MNMTKNNVIVAGVGMIPFAKPGQSESYHSMGTQAGLLALKDAGIDYSTVRQAYVGYVYGDSTCGQAAVYGLGVTGIPVVNVNNNCSSGSTALYLARKAIQYGDADCVLALGFEQMVPGALGSNFPDRPMPTFRFDDKCAALLGEDKDGPWAARFFGGAGMEYQDKYGASDEIFAQISVKARRHAANNPMALFQDPITVEEVLQSKHIHGPLTRVQCCPPTCGAAAAILCSPEFARKHGISEEVAILGQSLCSDTASTFDEDSMIKLIGYDVTKNAAKDVYEEAGFGPDDVDVVELHDCFTTNELLTYEGLGFVEEGEGAKFVLDGENTYGGKIVTNPSGGLLSKGHPLGATGLAQCYELVQQLRGRADKRQVEGAKIALQHNLGLGSAIVVTMYGAA